MILSQQLSAEKHNILDIKWGLMSKITSFPRVSITFHGLSDCVVCGLTVYGPVKSGQHHSSVRAGIGLTNLCS